jgi:hypothetical protein
MMTYRKGKKKTLSDLNNYKRKPKSRAQYVHNFICLR